MPPPPDHLLASETAAAVRRRRSLAATACVLCTSLAALALSVHSVYRVERWLLVVTAASLVLAVLFGVAFLRSMDLLRAPLLRILREDPASVVWIYVTGERVHVRCAPRRSFVLTSISAGHVVAELAQWCPHAHLGWSPAVERIWSDDPMALRAR